MVELDEKSNTCETILFITDLEGCVDDFFGAKQNVLLCQSETFNAINVILSNDKGLHIAFLGDYFDQGSHMVESINGIADLITKHPKQVHVILGNRDLNKMRIHVEKDMTETSYSGVWTLWDNKLKEVPVGPLERTKYLLSHTYGAEKLLFHLSTELNITENDALSLFEKIFTNTNSNNEQPNVQEFITSCKTLFKNGKLLDIIQLENGKQVLLSHGGTFSPTVFCNSITPISTETLNYYAEIEHYRSVFDTISSNNYRFDKINRIIAGYNTLYKTVLNELETGETSATKLSEDYYKLQAMGLKGTTNNQDFASPVESCVLNSGCNNNPIKDINEQLADYLLKNNIHYISHGHVPFCGTVPIIHKNKDIIFISNDTSNGNRPDSFNSLIEIPLTYVKSDAVNDVNAVNVGICSIDSTQTNEKINYNLDKIKAYNKGENPNEKYYSGFLKQYNNKNKIMTTNELNKYFAKEGTFPAMLEYNAIDAPAGGKRRRTRRKNKNKNAKKTNKKGKSKKYRKKGRKTRKIRRRK